MPVCEAPGIGAFRLAASDGRSGRADPHPIVDAAGGNRLAASDADRAALGGRIAYTGGMTDADVLPDDVPTLKAVIARQRAEIAHLTLWVTKLRRYRFGRRSERVGTLLNQLELQLEDLEVGATERDARTDPVDSDLTY